MSFISELYTDITMQSILYRLVKSLIHILFSDLSSQINLLNSSYYLIIFSHKKHITVNNVVYANVCVSIHSERSL